MNKKIFTFWEPENNTPGYLKLCLKTWEKYLPDYEIIILNYKNLDKYLGKNFYDTSLYKNYSLAKQADAIRCAILEQNGGIWLDLDTIITSNKFFETQLNNLDTELAMFGKHLGFIYAQKHSKILKSWVAKVKEKLIWDRTNLLCRPLRNILRIFNPKKVQKMMKWDVLGNGLLNQHLMNAEPKEYISLCNGNYDYMPECKFANTNNLIFKKNEIMFQNFYIENDYSDYVLDNSRGIVLLHNSWMPNKYKKLSEKEFLKLNNTLSNLLKKLL